jgi:chitinase
VGDVFNQPLAGNFNQLRKLKQLYPHLRVHLSIGGWTWSRFFSDATLTPESREALVASCVDLFIEGNLPILDDAPHGGPGSAFGVFDGIDLDWEWPASEGNPHNVVRPEDRENYTALAAEFRRQLDLAGAAHGRHYALTAFLPADPAKIAAGIEIGPLFETLDFATIQGYDLHGPWDPTTNHQSQLFSPPADPDPNRFSVDLAVQAYLTGGAPPGKVVVGIPYYGRGWTGVTNAGDGLYQGSGGPARGTFEDGVEDYKKLVAKKGSRFYDPVAGAHWLFDGRNFWSYDNLEVIAQKTAYVRAGGLGGTMVWSLDADTGDAELTTAINQGLGAATLPATSPR